MLFGEAWSMDRDSIPYTGHVSTLAPESTPFVEELSYSAAVLFCSCPILQLSYSAAVSKSCFIALAPKKIQAIVQKVSEKEEQNGNFNIYGLEENDTENLIGNVEEVLREIGEKPRIQDCCRVANIANRSPANIANRSPARSVSELAP
ncbi:hypothetical protein ACHWQZ_G015815 [Mnemiopsis leidyi]